MKPATILKYATRPDAIAVLAWQLGNYLIPLALLPYLGRQLGVVGFGHYGTALAIVNLCLMVTDWGFMYTAQKALIECNGDPNRENAVIWETFTAKLLLGLLCIVFVLVGVTIADLDPTFRLPIVIGCSAVFANVLSMEWLLRARQMFWRFALASVLGRSLSIPATLLAVHDAGDAHLAIGALAFGQIASAIGGIFLALKSGIGKPYLPLFGALQRIRFGTPLFVPIAASNLYSVFTPPLLAALSTVTQAGIFSGPERLKGAARMMLYPITVVAYPKINQLRHSDPDLLRQFMPRLVLLVFFGSGLVCGAFIALAEPIVKVALGDEYIAAVPVLRVLGASAFVASLIQLTGTNILIAFGDRRGFLLSHMFGLGLTLVGIIAFSPRFGALGAAISSLVGETFTLGIQLFFVRNLLPWLLPDLRSALKLKPDV